MANIQYCHILQPGVLQQNYTLEAELFNNKWSFYHNHKENPKDYNLLNSTLDIPYRFHQKHEGGTLIPLHAYSSKLCCWWSTECLHDKLTDEVIWCKYCPLLCELHRVFEEAAQKSADFDDILERKSLKGKLNYARCKRYSETDQVLQSCGMPERFKKRKQVINTLKTGLLRPCEKSACDSIPIARRCSFHIKKSKVSMSASQPGTLLMFVLTARAQPVHLHPIEKKGEAEWETMVPLWHKLEGLWNHRNERVQRKRLCFMVGPLHLLYLIYIVAGASSPLRSGSSILSCIS